MTDFMLDNRTARTVITRLGLPVPVPEILKREDGPYRERPLEGMTLVVGAAGPSSLDSVLATVLTRAGAMVQVTNPRLVEAFAAPGEAYGRPVRVLDLGAIGVDPTDAKPKAKTKPKTERLAVDGLVFDATACSTPDDLRAVHAFFHPLVRRLHASGRIVVLGRPSVPDATAQATQLAVEGFVRSLAKEIGRRGSTAQLVTVEPGSEERVDAVLRFVLSKRSAFVSGQRIHVTARARGTLSRTSVRPLEGKVALVTGAARGIGAATARRLADEGARVVCLDRPADDGLVSRLAHEIGGTVLLADITDRDAPVHIVSALEQRHGGVDIVIHNAGITRDKTLGKMTAEQWDATIDTNFGSVVRMTEALLERGLHDGGRLVFLSSVVGIAGGVGQANYAASKAGLIGYARGLSTRLHERGITSNAVAPGFIETRLTAAIPLVVRELARRLSNLGQGGLPRDVAEAITFLATPDAVGVTGQVLRVCGGALIGA